MNLVKIIALLFFFTLIWVSCQIETDRKKDNALEALPTNSTIITAFDLPSLMKKANFEAVKKMDFYQFFVEKAQEESDILATVLANPENAGIDLSKKAYLSIELNPDNPEEFYTGIIFNLVSPDDFNNFAHSFRDARIDTRKNYHVADLNDATQLAWNDKIGVIALGENIYETEEVINSFFTSNTENSLSNNENLNKILAEKHDVTTWLTSNALAQNKNAKMVLSLAKINPEAIHNNFIHGFVDFEEGKVEAKLNYFFQEALVEDIRLLFKDHVKTDFSAYVTTKNLNSYLSAAFDFDGLNIALNKRKQVKMFVDFAIKSYGLSTQKLKNALDGDLVFATYTGNVNNRQEGLFALKLNNLADFESLMSFAERNEWVTKTQKGRYLIAPNLHKMINALLPFEIGSSFDNQILIKDNIAFISGNIERLDNIENGNIESNETTPLNIKSLVNQNPFAFLVDFNSLKRIGVPGAVDLDILTINSNRNVADFQLGMKNKKDNSLQAIFEAINQEYLKNREKRQPVSQEKS